MHRPIIGLTCNELDKEKFFLNSLSMKPISIVSFVPVVVQSFFQSQMTMIQFKLKLIY